MGRKNFYSYIEAKAAAQLLQINSCREYNLRYREDARLPAIPYRQYASSGWINWYDFLGAQERNFYASYEQAKFAVKALGISTSQEYIARYNEDSRLPATPYGIYAGIGWINWHDFLGKDQPKTLANFAEAKVIVRLMGVRARAEYLVRFREHPQLPSVPNKFYSKCGWLNWPDFLGVSKPDFYVAYADAQSSAQRLGISSKAEYASRFSEDPKLPPSPYITYANAGWINWPGFLRKLLSSRYTYAEAQVACQEMNIQSRSEYRLRHKEDSRLPPTPEKFYAAGGWVDWWHFIRRDKPSWYTYTEAQAVCRSMGIKNSIDYAARHHEDERLHSVPDRAYSDCGWKTWFDYLGGGRPLDPSGDYPNYMSDVERWLKNETNITKKRAAIRALLNKYVGPLGLPDDPKYLLLRETSFDFLTYQQMIEGLADSAKKPFHFAIVGFFQWLLYMDCTDEDSGELIVLREFRNPFKAGLSGIEEGLRTYTPSQSAKSPLGYEYILRARNFLVPEAESVLSAKPTLREMQHLHEFFSTRHDWITVEQSVIDRSDPNCVYRECPEEGLFQLWSPVRFIALYTLLRFPLRGQQILWLDSGEADGEVATLNEAGAVQWVKNEGELATNGRRQAAVQRGPKNAPRLYVTTNKTGRSFGGYYVDWLPDDLIYWFILLRDWQAKYNPIPEPTPWTSIKLKAETNVKILKARKDQCFLFRMYSTGQPFLPEVVFSRMLPMLLFKIQRGAEDLARLDQFRYVSPYTPHSLRVSLITAFIVDGEAPIHLVSKLVGHASLVMTIYYTKINSEQMRRPMGEVEKLAAYKATQRSADLIALEGIQALSSQLVVTDGNRSLISSETPRSACVVFDWGICPMSASACNMGGEVLVDRSSEIIYGSVEAGYLGQRNCTRCRFFVTGVPFLGGLVALANEIALEINTESCRYQECTLRLDNLEREHYDACQGGLPFQRERERKLTVASQQQSAGKLDVMLADYASINNYVRCCLKLINDGESGSRDEIRLVVTGDVNDWGVSYQESNTSYHLLAEICQNAGVYKSANPSRALSLISEAIDRMAENNDLAPAMFRLSSEQKIVVANELNKLLLKRLGSWEKIDDLFSGDLMLLDVDANEPELSRVSTEICKLFSKPHLTSIISHEKNYE